MLLCLDCYTLTDFTNANPAIFQVGNVDMVEGASLVRISNLNGEHYYLPMEDKVSASIFMKSLLKVAAPDVMLKLIGIAISASSFVLTADNFKEWIPKDKIEELHVSGYSVALASGG